MVSKKQRTLTILNDSSLSTTEKVDGLLKIRQESRAFQDIGERIPGSKKETAAIRVIYKHEDEIYMGKVAQEFDKYNLDEKTKQRMLDNARKTYGYEVGIQRLINKGDELKNRGYHKEAVKQCLDALYMVEEYRRKYPKDADELWCKKAIFMASNGMGIAYSKWGKPMGAIDSFQDAISYAPNEEARRVATGNLERCEKVLKDKTGVEFNTYFFDSSGEVSKI